MSDEYSLNFPRTSKIVDLNSAEQKSFMAFAAAAKSHGFDWWHAEKSACWGRKSTGDKKADIRLGRLLKFRGEAFITLSSEKNGKGILVKLHDSFLNPLGEHRRARWLIPISRALELFACTDPAQQSAQEDFLKSLLNLASSRDRVGRWESAWEDSNSDAQPEIPLEEEPEDPEHSVGCPPGFSIERLIYVRGNQHVFRREVAKLWQNKCAVWGKVDRRILIASHIVPWAEATAEEKTDPENGLLLSAPLDALFDLGLISFNDEGKMLCNVDDITAKAFGLNGDLPSLTRPISERTKKYLRRHRERAF